MSTDETKDQEATQEKPGLKDLMNLVPGSPSREQVESWKAQYGDVFVSGFSESEVYVWHTLNRKEYIELQQLMADPEKRIDQFKMEELVCDRCLLWPKVDWEKSKGGLASTLSEQIMLNSHFLAPQMASMLVAKL